MIVDLGREYFWGVGFVIELLIDCIKYLIEAGIVLEENKD